VITPQEAVDSVREKHIIGECLHEQDVMNPSKALVDKALKTWATKKMRADNTSVVTVILTPATEAATTTTTAATSANGCATDVDMLVELEPLDTENNYPTGRLGEELELDHDDLGCQYASDGTMQSRWPQIYGGSIFCGLSGVTSDARIGIRIFWHL